MERGTVIFEPGVSKVEKEREFGDLKTAMEQAFAADRVTKYLKELDRRKIRVRNLDAVFAADGIEGRAFRSGPRPPQCTHFPSSAILIRHVRHQEYRRHCAGNDHHLQGDVPALDRGKLS